MADLILDKFSQAALREANEGRNAALYRVAQLDAEIARLTAERDEQAALADACAADLDDYKARIAADAGADVKALDVERQADNSYRLVAKKG